MNCPNRSVVSCIAVALIGVLAACAAPPPPAPPPVDLAAEAQAIRDLSARWMELSTSRDQAAIMELFAEDAVTLSEDETPREGRAAIQANMQAQWTKAPDFVVNWSTTSVQVAGSADIAWERGTFQYDPDGAGEAAAEQGEYVTLYKKVDGVWKVALDIGVSTTPEPATTE